MLSYQHSYHAGNFADVMKHAILTRLLNYLTQKDKPLLYLETHAGRGLYDLQDKHALKTNESALGIQAVWENRGKLSSLFEPYLNNIQCVNTKENLRYYPGSPEIAIQNLRSEDRAIFCELHPAEFTYLQKLSSKRRISFKKEDGLKVLNAALPALERRGIIFIDPSYERKAEYQEITQALKAAYKRSATMTYCVWYPILNNQMQTHFLRHLKGVDENSLRLEFYISDANTSSKFTGMTGSGLWIINPPYTLAQEAKQMLKELTNIIQPQSSSYLIELG